MKIGSVVLDGNLLLAPMAGFTDIAYRQICRQHKAALSTTEMISAKGLCYNNSKTFDLLRTAQNEVPACVQLFGSESEFFVRAAHHEALKKFDIIDVNMGCPMPKITKNGEGSALLKNPLKASKIVEALSALGKPVTVKIRIGIDKPIDYVSFARDMQNAGAAALIVHGRTAAQLYAGSADYEAIGNVARALRIPVIASGDICSAQDAMQKIKDYSLAGAMVGRGAIGNPWIFSDYDKLLKDSFFCSIKPSKKDVADMILLHLTNMCRYFCDKIAITNIRKHLGYYLKNFVGIKPLRRSLLAASSVSQFTDILKELC